MEDLDSHICCGCLSKGRKMRLTQDYLEKQSFFEILNNHPAQLTDTAASTAVVRLCWECNALLKRFANFKLQVRNAYWTLQNYDNQAHNHQSLSHLSANKQYSLEYSPNEECEGISCEIITKTPDVDIKEELDIDVLLSVKSDCQETGTNIDSNYSDDDDKFLIDFSSTKSNKDTKVRSKTLNGVRKKRKKRVKDTDVVGKEIFKEIELTREEIGEERRYMLLREDYVNSMLKCERCIISFPNADDLNEHLAKKHNATAPYKCDICECAFASELSYNYHTNKHRRRFQCVACSERLGSRRAAEKHYDTAHCHGANYNYEELSTKKIKSNDHNTKLNGATDSGGAMFACDRCPKAFRWRTSLRKHAETHSIAAGDKRRPYCEPCSMSFTTTANLQKHVKTSSNHQIQLKLRKLKESQESDADAVTPESQKARIDQIKSAVVSKRQQFGCGQCDRKFQWRGNLLRHMQSHAARAAGELVCHPCNRSFSSIATYQQHLAISRKHVSEEQFKYSCSECNKRFVNKTRLSDHVAWEHLKEYVHVCQHCQKVFKSHTSLYLHMQVVHRNGKTEHLCDHCGKPFPNHAKLRSHITALHSGETPYKCPVCDARFSWHSCLSRHVRRTHRNVEKH